jgi:hypothetical protein
MAHVRRLTPTILKKIISEERQKIKKSISKKINNKTVVERGIDTITKLALMEVKELVKIKRLREKRKKLKKLLSKRVR